MQKNTRDELTRLSSDLKKLIKMLSDVESKRIVDTVKKLREADGNNNK